MLKFKSLICLLALSPAIVPPSASTPPSLTLDECVRRAEAAQSNVTIAQQQAKIARYARAQAVANFLPQASLGGLFTYNSPSLVVGSPAPFSFIALNGIREYTTLGTIGLEVDTSGRLRAELARAKADQDAAAATMIISQRDLRLAVAASFYRLALARKMVQVAHDNLTEAQTFERRNRLLVQNQEVAQADLVKASAQVAFFQQAVKAAELEAKLANHDLASFWTQDVDSELSIVDELDLDVPPPADKPSVTSPFLQRPEFRLFDAQQRGFLADARRARADMLPQLGLVEEYGVDSNRMAFADRGYASFIHLDVPVFDWLRAHNASRQFVLKAEQVETNREIAQRTFSKEYQDALERVASLYSQIADAEKLAQLSQENLRLSKIRYEGGEGTALDVVSAQEQLAQGRANYFAAKAAYLSARVELEVAEGQ